MTEAHHPDLTDVEMYDPVYARRVTALLRPVARHYFRADVRGLENLPDGAALVVSNHSGGVTATDVPVFAEAYYDNLGFERPLYTLSHHVMFQGPTRNLFLRAGYIPASPENAAAALEHGGLVIVFPGGGYDSMRPTREQGRIDFNGRTGYIRTALNAGVPIVPTVSIGGQETQLYLTRGTWLAERLGLKRLFRSDVAPISIGFPFLVSPGSVNLPLPSKIVTRVLPAIDVRKTFGKKPDFTQVDAHVRGVMQDALDELSRARRLPIVG